MKVLHVIKVQGIGGAEQHLLNLLPALRERGIDARLLSLDGGLDSQRFHDALSSLRRPLDERTLRCRCLAAAAARRRAGDADERPDLVHTHMVHGDVYGSLAARLTGTPFISSRHNDDRYLLGPFRHVDRGLMRGASRIIAISDAVRAFHIAAGLSADRLITIHYGLDASPSAASELSPADAGVEESEPLLLAVGRLIEQKDHATLLHSFSRIRAHAPTARLAILGWGPLEEPTRALAADLGLGDSVLIPGRVEPSAWLRRADVFVHSSRWEGFGLVLLEAMLSELPIVATRVSAVPEIVDDDRTGVLVPPGDDRAFAEAVTGLLDDDTRRAAMGRAGLDRARREFSVARMTDRTLGVYRKALA